MLSINSIPVLGAADAFRCGLGNTSFVIRQAIDTRLPSVLDTWLPSVLATRLPPFFDTRCRCLGIQNDFKYENRSTFFMPARYQLCTKGQFD